MASKKIGSEGTILLRQAEPKYKYVGRKLPKEPEEALQPKKNNSEPNLPSFNDSVPVETSSVSLPKSKSNVTDLSTMGANKFNPSSSSSKRPVAVVEASFPATATTSPINTNLTSFPSTTLSGTTNTNISSLPPQSTTTRLPLFSMPLPLEKNTTDTTTTTTFSLSGSKDENPTSPPLLETSAAAAALTTVTTSMLRQRLEEVEKERDKATKELASQLQVNSELKRLLVASVGDDLGKRVERLAQDRVQLSMDIGGFNKKMTEDYENLDKMSIQADMWRSKYLASRVMVEELGNARAYYSLQWYESQEALQQMLNERHELRANLLEAYKILQQVKDAFDPLNSHRSTSLASTNVLDLSRACQQLGEAVRFRLLPAHVASSSSVEIDVDQWESCVTRAEQYAHELLSRPSEPTGSLQSGNSRSVLPLTGTGSTTSPVITRYHPHVRHENFTVHCCKCTGEIRVV